MYIETSVNGTTSAATFSIRSNPLALYSCYVTANTSVGEGTPSSIVTGSTGESGETFTKMSPLKFNPPCEGIKLIVQQVNNS